MFDFDFNPDGKMGPYGIKPECADCDMLNSLHGHTEEEASQFKFGCSGADYVDCVARHHARLCGHHGPAGRADEVEKENMRCFGRQAHSMNITREEFESLVSVETELATELYYLSELTLPSVGCPKGHRGSSAKRLSFSDLYELLMEDLHEVRSMRYFILSEHLREEAKKSPHIIPPVLIPDGAILCKGCGKLLTEEEQYYYETTCEECEKREYARTHPYPIDSGLIERVKQALFEDEGFQREMFHRIVKSLKFPPNMESVLFDSLAEAEESED